MSTTDREKILIGAVLVLVATAIVLAVSTGLVPGIPALIGSLAMLGLAAGALLIGTSESEGRPV